jgi:nitrate reductase gamma subunit
MGTVLILAGYVSTLVFIWRVIWRLLLWAKSRNPPQIVRKTTVASIFMAVVDILMLRRLFLVNKGMWIGEWVFHACFVLVVMRHMKYFFHPVPGVIILMQPLGVFAGHVLPVSLLYILLYRFAVERARYVSSYNLFLTATLFLVAITGLLMRRVFRADVVDVKEFIMGWLALSPAEVPESNLFIIHFLLVIILVPFLPSHIFTAPVIAFDSEKREEGVDLLLHGKK